MVRNPEKELQMEVQVNMGLGKWLLGPYTYYLGTWTVKVYKDLRYGFS